MLFADVASDRSKTQAIAIKEMASSSYLIYVSMLDISGYKQSTVEIADFQPEVNFYLEDGSPPETSPGPILSVKAPNQGDRQK